MSIFSFISSIFKPAADLIDDLVTTDEERLQLKTKLKEVENEFQTKRIDLDKIRFLFFGFGVTI